MRPQHPQHPRPRDPDPVQDPQPRVDRPLALALTASGRDRPESPPAASRPTPWASDPAARAPRPCAAAARVSAGRRAPSALPRLTHGPVRPVILLPAPPASAQSRDDFAYWAGRDGDLTCAEAGPASAGGRDEGLRLPAYQDDRDGTGIIYEWLERGRSSDSDNDGVACQNSSNPNGYIPNVQVQPPVETQVCSADAETWRGLKICDERPRDGYDRDAFGTGYSSLEDEIIAALPPTMKANGQVYEPPTRASRSTSRRTGPRRRTSSTSWRWRSRTTAASPTIGAGTLPVTSITSRSRIRR